MERLTCYESILYQQLHSFALQLLTAKNQTKRNQTLSRFRQERQLLFRVREPIPSLSAQTEKLS